MKYKLKKIKKLCLTKKDNKTRSLIYGENLIALNLLEKNYKDKIKCIYIDPPYNNGENYYHYNDKKKDNWISEIKERLIILRRLLKRNGSIWISIDDYELHYLKVLLDSIFKRENFVTTIVWQQRNTKENRTNFSNNHEYILVYAKNKKIFDKEINKLPANNEMIKRYKNPDNDPRGLWQSISLNVQDGHAVKSQFYLITSPSGKKFSPPKGRCWAYNQQKIKKLISENKIWFGQNNNSVPRLKKYLKESILESTPETLWLGEDVGTNKDAKKLIVKMFPNKKIFDTPKPEKLLERIFTIATNPEDIILDCYVGSGVSVAVAHKMNRQYIGIDKGKQIIDYSLARLKLVTKGKDIGIKTKFKNISDGLDFFKIEK